MEPLIQQKIKLLGQKLLELLEQQSDITIDLSSCLSSVRFPDMDLEGNKTDQDFDYDSFVCELFENQPKTLPRLQKLTMQHILELKHATAMTVDEYYHYDRLNYGMMQLSCLSELELRNVPGHFHDNLQLWNLTNLTKLSITHSKLQNFPVSVGRLRQLQTLDLSHNKLTSLPNTLSFCKKINTLDIRDNSFELFPSVIMCLESLTTLRRLNTFPKTGYSIIGPTCTKKSEKSTASKKIHQPLALQMNCAKVLLASQLDYWESDEVGVLQCKMLDKLAEKLYACDNCNKMLLNEEASKLEVEVTLVTFKELTYVPFLLRACSIHCQETLYDSYSNKNQALQQELDIQYKETMKQAHKDLEEENMKELLHSNDVQYTPPRRHPLATRQRNRMRQVCCTM